MKVARILVMVFHNFKTDNELGPIKLSPASQTPYSWSICCMVWCALSIRWHSGTQKWLHVNVPWFPSRIVTISAFSERNLSWKLHIVRPTPETAERGRRTVSLQTPATNDVWAVEKIMWLCNRARLVRMRRLAVVGLRLDGYDLHSSPGMWYQDKVKARLVPQRLTAAVVVVVVVVARAIVVPYFWFFFLIHWFLSGDTPRWLS